MMEGANVSPPVSARGAHRHGTSDDRGVAEREAKSVMCKLASRIEVRFKNKMNLLENMDMRRLL